MSWELVVASIIFIATYAAISLRRLPGIEIGMHTAALPAYADRWEGEIDGTLSVYIGDGVLGAAIQRLD